MITKIQFIGQRKVYSYLFLPERFYLKFFVLPVFFFISFTNSFAQVGISSSSITPDASSILELRSTTSGFLLPRMTTKQRDAIASPAPRLVIYSTITSQLNYYRGSGASRISVALANGFASTSANAITTPAITTSVIGIGKGIGKALFAETPGTDYSADTSAIITTVNLSIATASDFQLCNQNKTGNALKGNTNANLTGDVTSVGNATILAIVILSLNFHLYKTISIYKGNIRLKSKRYLQNINKYEI